MTHPYPRTPTAVDQVADAYVDALSAASPQFATLIGRPDGADRLDDFSPDGHDALADLRTRTLTSLAAATPVDDVDRVTIDAMRRDLSAANAVHAAGLHYRDLNVIASPAQAIREIFDASPAVTEDDWTAIATRMRAVPAAITGYTRTLREGITRGITPARRQVLAVAAQVTPLGTGIGFFRTLAQQATRTGTLPASLTADLHAAATAASTAYAQFVQFLTGTLAAAATTTDPIGRDHYRLLSTFHTGAALDLDAMYTWGLDELARITSEQEQLARQLTGGGTVPDAVAFLNSDPDRQIHGTAALATWMQTLSDTAITALAGTHFDIPDPIRTLECRIAPTTSGAIYYIPPTADLSRPGRMWWSVPANVTAFTTWRETTNIYHEGAPGHHLQVAQQVTNPDLNSWRALACMNNGYAEGWALYAERLMADLGYLNDPGDRFGMLDGQRMRAARVVVDLGLHLGKPRLDGRGPWDFSGARTFMGQHTQMAPAFVDFEVLRYTGWPGQAPTYKVGQRTFEHLRDTAAAAAGPSFDVKAWHSSVLALGAVPLDTLAYAQTL